ncbi:MAG: hypothetical protein K6G68_04915 [Oscillospiraceae bacterium]|nr:hypothetical protein [Oscillospiraceae bacterium]
MRNIGRMTAALCLAAVTVLGSAVKASAAKADDWKSVYAGFLNEKLTAEQEYPDSIDAFSIYDLHADGTPELIVSQGDYHGAYCTIYTISDGKLTHVGDAGSNGICGYVPAKKYVTSCYIGMGYMNLDYFTMDKDGLNKVISFCDDSGNASDDNDFEITYTIDEEKVTADEYEKKLGEMQSSPSVPLGRTFPLSEKSIEYAVTGVSSRKAGYSGLLTECYLESDYREDGDRFFLSDITGDKKPELFVFTSGGMDIFTFRDGVVRFFGNDYPYRLNGDDVKCRFGFNAERKILVIRMESVAQKTYSYSFCHIGKNGIKKAVDIARTTDSEGDTVYWMNSEYSSLHKVNAVLKKYSGIKFRMSSKFYSLIEDEIKRVLG